MYKVAPRSDQPLEVESTSSAALVERLRRQAIFWERIGNGYFSIWFGWEY